MISERRREEIEIVDISTNIPTLSPLCSLCLLVLFFLASCGSRRPVTVEAAASSKSILVAAFFCPLHRVRGMFSSYTVVKYDFGARLQRKGRPYQLISAHSAVPPSV